MRTYATNSPRAAARIVVLAMLADGHLSRAELEALDRFDAYAQLGLDREGVRNSISDFCDDLLSSAHLSWADACRIDARSIEQIMAEVEDLQLRRLVLRLCVSVVEADGHVAEGESLVLTAAVQHWGLQREMLTRTDSEPRPIGSTPT